MPIFYTDSGSFGDITVSGSAIVSGTLSFSENSGGLTGSLFGTSSWANNAQSASFIEFVGIANKPELISSSGQISITQTTGYSTFSSSIATKNDTQDISISALNSATSSYALQTQLQGVVSTSAQVKSFLPGDTVSSSAQVKSFLPVDTVSSSGQVNITQTTGYSTFSSSIATKNDAQDISINALNAATSSYAIQSQLAGVVSSSTQVKTLLPTDTVSGSTASSPSQGTVRVTINGVNTDVDTGLQTSDSPTFSGLTSTGTVLLANIYSASNQVTISSTTGYSTFSSSIATKNDTQDVSINSLNTATSSYAINSTIQSQLAGVVSSSTQVQQLLPPNTVSGSTASSPSQGTVRVTINGVNMDVDTGLQTNDSPSFTAITTTSTSSIATVYSSSNQVVSAIVGQTISPTNLSIRESAVITGSLLVSGSGIRTTGSLNLVSGSATFRNEGSPLIINGNVIHSNFEAFPRIRVDIGTNGVYFGSAEMAPELTDNYGLGSPTNIWKSLVVNQVSASNIQLNNLTDTTSTNKVLVLNTATNQIFTTASVGSGGGPVGNAFPYDGRTTPAIISGSLLISSSATGLSLQVTGSTNLRDNLTVNGGTLFVDTVNNRVITSGSAVITGSVNVSGSITTTAGNFFINSNAITEDATLTIGDGRTGNGFSYIDIVGDTVYTDYGLRIIRTNTGQNAESNLTHRGLGNFTFVTFEAAPIVLATQNQERLRVQADGDVGIGVTDPLSKLQVQGNISASSYTSSLNNQVGFFGTSSWAQQAVSASYFSGSASFPDGLTVGQLTASNAQLTNIVDTTATNKILVLNTTNNQIFTTASVGGGGSGTGNGFPYDGRTVPAVISGSLNVSGSGIHLSGSALTGSVFSGSFFNIIEMSMAVSGTITASGTTTVTLDMNKSNYYAISGSGTGTVTWVVNNPPPVGRAQTFILDYTNGGIKTNNWFTNTRWPGGVAPTLTSASAAPDILSFTTDDAGSNWRGVLLQRASQ